MKNIIALATLTLSLIGGSAKANESGLEKMATPQVENIQFVAPSEESYATPVPQKIRVLVEFVVTEEGRNYVVFIHSNNTDWNQKIIKMIEQAPVNEQEAGTSKKVVIEYEL